MPHVQTTPGCNEGLLWHVMQRPHTITAATLDKMRRFVAQTADATGAIVTYRDNNRGVQPLNGRTVLYHADAGALMPIVVLFA